MAAVPTLFVAILFLGVTTSWCSEEPSPLKINKGFFPKKYQQEATTTEIPSTTTGNPEEPTPEFTSEEEALERSKKSASATVCVEIRPSNPYEKPFQVCEAQQQHYGYVKQPTQQYGYGTPHRPAPVKYYQPHGNPQPSYPEQQSYQHSQPSYQYEPQQPQQHQAQESSYDRPVMVLPHVPVVQPYHVPSKPSYKPSGGYRSSGGYGSSGHGSSGPYDVDEMAANPDEFQGNMDARSAYYGDEGGYGGESYGGHKVPLFEYHKKKEVSYLPVTTYEKPKHLKFLKVLKDLKKDKYGYEDDYYQPQYYRPPPPHYGGYSHSAPAEHEAHKDSSHGLVITCQPSAVGYTGQQNQVELSKHMDLLKNIYTQSEKLYNQQQLSSSPGGYRSSSGGEAEGNMRSTGGGWEKNQAEGGMRSSGGGWEKNQAEGGMRSSGGGWQKNQAEGGMRSSGGGWEKNQAEGSMRSSGGGWQKNPAEEGMRSSGGGWDKSQAEGGMRKSGGGWEKSQADGAMRSSGGGWEKNQAEAAMRSSGGGWEKNQAEAAMRSSGGGWDKSQAEGGARSSGGGWQPSQMDENVGKTQAMSVGPNPTTRLMTQKEMETTAAFRNAQNSFADMQRGQM